MNMSTDLLPHATTAPALSLGSHGAEEFRVNGGRVGGQFDGAPLLLLHTIGSTFLAFEFP
jgi:hypothetical protein